MVEFSQGTVFRSDIAAFRRKVRAELDRALPDGASRVAIRLQSGQMLGETVIAARGSQSDPLSDGDLEAKLRAGLRQGGSSWDGERTISAVWRLDELADMSSLLRHSRPAAATSGAR